MDLATARLDDSSSDPHSALMAFAMEHLRRLSDPHVIASCQLYSAEATQYAEARALYRNGADTLPHRLAAWLEIAKQRVRSEHDDAHCATEFLLGMIVGLDLERQRFSVPHRDTEAKRLEWVRFAIDSFIKAFAPTTQRPPGTSPLTHSLPASQS